MEYHGDFPISYRSNITKGSSLSPQFLREGAMWPMNLSSIEIGESKTYPERPGEEDCSYYLRTGSCRYGMSCRFNHPIDRSLIMAEAHINGTYPERIGQPECQYYLKTGTCKFGATCKFHHPRDKAGVTGRVALNVLGYPLRQNEKECAYYLRTGQCKFGNTCKFHHPQPSSSVVSLGNSPVYTSVHSTTTTGQQSYPSDWSLSIPGSRWQGASNYARLILPQAMVPIPGWNAYTVTPSLPSGQMETISSSKSQQQNPSASQFRGTAPQINTPGYNSFSLGNYTLQRESTFPVRPGEPECQFYMKTGDCKFGAVCKFHHPKERIIPVPNCMLSPLGLPLRPGEPLCIFYSRYGICKFGPNCKFDHPMSAIEHTIPSPISSNVQVQQFLVSSSGFATLSLASNDTLESSNGKSRRISISETRQLASADENNEEER